MTQVFVTERDQIVAYQGDEETLADNFRRFHADNPHVYATLVKLARRWRRSRPRRKCSTKMLFETARWYLDLRGAGEPIALNNNYTAFYARLIMDQEPDLQGIFETRRQRASLDAAPDTDLSPAGAASNEDGLSILREPSHGCPDDRMTTQGGGPVLVLFPNQPDQDRLFAA